jgi:glycosyltransferase involved in cell wall biosynthesis
VLVTAAEAKRLRIGYDVSQTGPGAAGCGQMADALVRSLIDLCPEDRFILYPVFGTLYFDPHEAGRINRIVRPHVTYELADRRAADLQVFWKNPPPNAASFLGNPDLVHANNFFCPILTQTRVVYTLHDLASLDHPEYTTRENVTVCAQGIETAGKFADMIVAVSDFTRRRFLEVYPDFPEERIRVLHLASRFETTGREDPVIGLRENGFWLSVGTFEPRKNLRALLRAYAAHVRSFRDALPLALAGGKGWMEEGLAAFVDELGLREKVVLLGYVHDAQLRWLYRNCWAFCYPSLYEGFGLPLLEALSMGAASITSDVTSLPEIGGDAVLYVNPSDVQDIARGFTLLAGDSELRNALRSKSTLRAGQFSWRGTAERMRAIYAECVELPKRASGFSAVEATSSTNPSGDKGTPSCTSDTSPEFPHASLFKSMEVALYLFVKRRQGLKDWLRRFPPVSFLLAAYHRASQSRGR